MFRWQIAAVERILDASAVTDVDIRLVLLSVRRKIGRQHGVELDPHLHASRPLSNDLLREGDVRFGDPVRIVHQALFPFTEGAFLLDESTNTPDLICPPQ